MEWITVEDRFLSGMHLKVKRENGDELKAYYYSDGMAWLLFYKVKTSRFLKFDTNEFLFDVTHWAV